MICSSAIIRGILLVEFRNQLKATEAKHFIHNAFDEDASVGFWFWF